jgi:cytochrome c-type biogenesis protein CcmH
MPPETMTPSLPRRRESSFYRHLRAARIWLRVFVAATLFLVMVPAHAEVETPKPPIQLDDQQEALYKSLLPELRCLVCQNESLAESQASLAADLRYEVRGLVAKGDDEEQIKKYLTDRYGNFVLYKPPLEPRTYVLWFGPFLLLLLGLVTAVGYARRSRGAAPASPQPDADALKKILDENP